MSSIRARNPPRGTTAELILARVDAENLTSPGRWTRHSGLTNQRNQLQEEMLMISIARILVPTDFSEFGELALEYGAALAEKFSSDLYLLNVIDDYFILAPEANLALPDRKQYLQDLETASAQNLSKLLRGVSLPRVSQHTVVGRAYAEIVRYANEQRIEMIVMGTHGRSGLSHLLLGSVAERVVRTAGCPVLTVRPNQDHSATQEIQKP